jgi:hypothetical protein
MQRASSLALVWISILAMTGTGIAASKEQHDKGPKQEKKAHKHKHNSGHAALGEKIKQNGKHAVGKVAGKTVTADVQNGKVKNMSAEDLPVKRVKSKQKMAEADNGIMLANAAAAFHLVQYDDYYYGYCFDDGYELTCYWYPAEEVDYADYSWEDYDPYY